MKKIAITAMALCIAAAGATAFACEGPKGAHDGKRFKDPEKRLEHLSEKLELTAAQREQAQQILAAERGKHEAAHADTKAALAKILTGEQAAKFEEMRKQGPRGEHGKPGDAPQGK